VGSTVKQAEIKGHWVNYNFYLAVVILRVETLNIPRTMGVKKLLTDQKK